MSRISVLLLAAFLVTLCIPLVCQDAPPVHTKQEILARWGQCRPTFTELEVMEEYCRVTDDPEEEYVIGTPKAGFMEDGLRMLNFVRYLAGLPDDLELDEEYSFYAQALTMANILNGRESHDPAQPEGMPDELYEMAFAAGHKSNLHSEQGDGNMAKSARQGMEKLGWGPSMDLTLLRLFHLPRAVLEFVSDSDLNNVYKIGHRRHIFRQEPKYVGFGYLDYYDEWDLPEEERKPFMDDMPWIRYEFEVFSTLYIVDSSREKVPSYDFVAWPPRGYMPVEFWDRGMSMWGICYPWSVTLSPGKFKVDDRTAIAIEIAGVGNGYKCSIGKKDMTDFDSPPGDDLQMSDLKKYYRYLPASASWDASIVFSPGGEVPVTAKPGDRYRVTIRGVKDAKTGKPVVISYWTEFMELTDMRWLTDTLHYRGDANPPVGPEAP